MANGFMGQPKNLQELRALHESQNAQAESRGQDLRLAQMLVRALDPAVPKGFRQLGLRQVAGVIGVDPKGSSAKEVINVLAGLDPQSLERLRDGLAATSGGAQPGQVSEMARGLLSGAVPPETMLSMVSQAMQPPMMAGGPKGPTSFESEEQEFGISEAGFGFYPKGKQAAPGQATFPKSPTTGWEPTVTREPSVPEEEEPLVKPIPFPEPMRLGGPREEEPTEGMPPIKPAEVAPGRREVEGELPALLGIEPGRYRLEDLRKAGWDRIPDDPERRGKMIEDIRLKQEGTLNSLTMINQVAGLIRGRPDVLDFFSLRVPYLGELGGINLAAVAENVEEFLQVLGVREDKDKVNLSELKLSSQNRGATEAAMALIERSKEGGRLTASEAAEVRARVNAIMVPLAYAMARASHGTGVLSNQDVMVQLERLGKSPDPESFSAALATTADQIFTQYKQGTKTQTGKEVPISHLVTPETEAAFDVGGLTPKNFWGAKPTTGPGRFSEPRLAPRQLEKVAAAEPTIGQEEEYARGRAKEELAFQREQKAAFRTEQARAEERQEMARRGEARQERSEARQERAEERAIEREERMIRDKQIKDIQDTFVQLGRSLRSQQQIGVQLPGAPGQEAGAFQVGGIPRERRAPAIPGRR